jgi:hypothetical protein
MYDHMLLDTQRLLTVSTPALQTLRDMTYPVYTNDPAGLRHAFVEEAEEWFLSSELNHLTGLGFFPVLEATMGCMHAIDSLIMRHGLGSLQIFDHDYHYYERLEPRIRYAEPGQLSPGLPVLMALPSPGWLDVHPRMYEILDEALDKHCDVHLDCAWITAARDISFDFSHPAISSVFMSLSKGMDLWWNRVGLRWSHVHDPTDPVTIYNEFNMMPTSLFQVGLTHVRTIPRDHVWQHHGARYQEICGDLRLRPTKIVHVAQSLDRGKMYGLKNLLESVG